MTDKIERMDNRIMDEHEEFSMTKILLDKYNEFPKETELYSWALALEDNERYFDFKMNESYEEGMVKGKEEERLAVAKRLVSKKYQVEDVTWLDTLTSKQVDAIFDYVLEIEDVSVFKQKILEVEE